MTDETKPACRTCAHWWPVADELGECAMAWDSLLRHTAPDDRCGQWVSRLFRGAPRPIRDEW